MRKIRKCNNLNNSEWNLNLMFFSKNTLLLDIETTGLSPDTAYIYTIGTAYWTAGSFVIEQFFAESPEEEALLLQETEALLQWSAILITYHGTKFDLPFLEKRFHHLNMTADNLKKYMQGERRHIDLHKVISSYKHILNLENYKQKTAEKLFHINREDNYNGKQLIKIYQTYKKSPDAELLQILLQHNQEDLQGMAKLLPFFSLDELFHGNFIPVNCNCSRYTKADGTGGEELIIECCFPGPFPVSLSCNNDLFYLHISGSTSASSDIGQLSRNTKPPAAAGQLSYDNASAVFRVRLYNGTLKYFYPDYKNYYYLLAEDTVIHKSLAAYVDKAYRKKAAAASCYVKKSGLFLPQYGEIITPAFYKEYKDAVSYFEMPENPLDDTETLKNYCLHILHILKSGR